jgi:hypothetical protein
VATFQFDSAFVEQLDKVARSAEIAPNVDRQEDVIRRAVALYMYLHTEADTNGLRVATIDSLDKIIKIIDPLP